jgi:hypothetical protein
VSGDRIQRLPRFGLGHQTTFLANGRLSGFQIQPAVPRAAQPPVASRSARELRFKRPAGGQHQANGASGWSRRTSVSARSPGSERRRVPKTLFAYGTDEDIGDAETTCARPSPMKRSACRPTRSRKPPQRRAPDAPRTPARRLRIQRQHRLRRSRSGLLLRERGTSPRRRPSLSLSAEQSPAQGPPIAQLPESSTIGYSAHRPIISTRPSRVFTRRVSATARANCSALRHVGSCSFCKRSSIAKGCRPTSPSLTPLFPFEIEWVVQLRMC